MKQPVFKKSCFTQRCLSAAWIVSLGKGVWAGEGDPFSDSHGKGHMQVSGLFMENGGKLFPVLSHTRAIDGRWVHGRREQFKLRQNFS